MRTHRGMQWASRLFLAVAIFLLGYYVFIVVDAWLFEKREVRRLERGVRGTSTPDVSHAPPVQSAKVPEGNVIGRIEIPRLDLAAVIVEGSGAASLRRGVGHIPETPLPGQAGNVAIAGHRDTVFRPLRKIRKDDVIALTTSQGEYRYRVVSTSIVNPRDVSVLRPTGEDVLTMITCYPFYFVGSAPDRFIVRAQRIPSGAR